MKRLEDFIAMEKSEDRFPEVTVSQVVSVTGGAGWRVYAREDLPMECCVITQFDRRMYFRRVEIPRLIAMLSRFKEALDETYGPLK